MEAYKEAFKLLFTSIFRNDLYILIFALFTFFMLYLTKSTTRDVKERIDAWRKDKNRDFSGFLCDKLKMRYTIFTTCISIFPLLGMFGTVVGLLGLDLAGGDMENIRSNFFTALTSTAWGIIFSVIFKWLHATMADFTEKQIDISNKLTEEAKQ